MERDISSEAKFNSPDKHKQQIAVKKEFKEDIPTVQPVNQVVGREEIKRGIMTEEELYHSNSN